MLLIKRMKKGIGKAIISIFLMVILTMGLCLSVSMFRDNQKWSHFNADGYTLLDQFIYNGGENLADFFAQEDSLDKLIQMYDLCRKEWGSSYYVVSNQPVIVTMNKNNSPYSDSGVSSYSSSSYSAESVQMNANAINGAEMYFEAGRAFSDSEYIFNEENVIPVIVGSNYKDTLEIDDTFEINYMNRELSAKVIGKLEKGSRSPKTLESYLDNYIIIPALEISDSELSNEEMSFWKKVYLDHTNGFIFSEDSALTVQNQVDNICKEVGIKNYILTGIYPISIFGLGYAMSIYIVFGFIWFICLLILVLVCVIAYKKEKKFYDNTDTVTDSRVYIMLYIEWFVYVFIAGVMCLALNSTWLFGGSYPFIFTAVENINIIGVLIALWIIIPLTVILKCIERKRL